MKTLRTIAKRLREYEPANAAAANLYHKRLTAQAAEFLSEHWLSEFGNFPSPEAHGLHHGDPERQFAVWALVFKSITYGLRCDFPGEIPETGQRVAKVIRPDEGVVITGFVDHDDDWKMRALDAADVCEWLADRLEVSPEQLEHLEHPKIKYPTNPEVAEVGNLVNGGMNVSEACREVAEKTGSNWESLRTVYNRWKTKNIG